MKFFGGGLGLLFILGIGFYIWSIQVQTRDVAEFCSTYPEGSRAEDFFTVAERYSGNLMGEHKFTDKDRPQQFVYCAPLTMCDVSCNVEIENGVVTKSEYRRL